MSKVAIIGSGSFGCVLANLIKENGNDVKIWSYSEEEKNNINNNHYCDYIKAHINDDIKCTNSIEEAVKDTDYLVIVTPSYAVRSTCTEINKYIGNQKVLLASKGLEGEKVLSEVAKEELGRDISVISGPSHAEQIYKKDNTSFDYYGSPEIKKLLENDYIELTDSDDPIGMQYGGALKNIIAIGYGREYGIGASTNTLSAYLTRCYKEMISIGVTKGAKLETFLGYSGFGDLQTTIGSMDSRNLKCGILLGKGLNLDEIKDNIGMTIEGLNVLESAYSIIIENELDCPEIERLYLDINKGKKRSF